MLPVVTEIALDAALDPQPFCTEAVYVPAVDTLMLVPLCPFDQLTLQPEHTLEAVKVTF